jgi:hypothetical protein
VPENEGERAWLEEFKRGNPSTYEPTTTLQALMGYMPALATDSSPLGAAGTAMANLRSLSWGEPFEPQASRLAPRDNRNRMERDGALLFSLLEDKAEVAKLRGRDVEGPDETVRTTIVEKALLGRYDGPQFLEDVKRDPVALARNLHRLEGSYTPLKTKEFEEKLASLVSRGAGNAKAGAGKVADAKTSKAKTKDTNASETKAKAKPVKAKAKA